MTQHRLRQCLLGLIFSLLTGVVHADRPVRILYFQAPTDAPSEAYMYAGPALAGKVTLPRNNFSETFEIPASKRRIKLTFLPNPLEDGAKPDPRSPSVRIPPQWSKVLLLVSEDRDNSAFPIKVIAINASNNAFGPGSIYMMNLSKIRVGGTIGNKRIDLRPRSVQIVKSPSNKNGVFPAKLYSVVKPGERPRRFIKQMWGHDDKVRKVLFIMPRPAPQHATYYCAPIRDF